MVLSKEILDGALVKKVDGLDLMQTYEKDPGLFRDLRVYAVSAQLALVLWLLGFNTGNRPLSRTQVTRLKRLFIRKQWVLSSHGVALGSNMVLNNGQHQLVCLKELAEAGSDITRTYIMLTVGESEDAKLAYDGHKVRVESDRLGISPKHVATITALVKALVCKGQSWTGNIEDVSYDALKLALFRIVEPTIVSLGIEGVWNAEIRAGLILVGLADINAADELKDQFKQIGSIPGAVSRFVGSESFRRAGGERDKAARFAIMRHIANRLLTGTAFNKSFSADEVWDKRARQKILSAAKARWDLVEKGFEKWAKGQMRLSDHTEVDFNVDPIDRVFSKMQVKR